MVHRKHGMCIIILGIHTRIFFPKKAPNLRSRDGGGIGTLLCQKSSKTDIGCVEQVGIVWPNIKHFL
jgi:hypothetical protein